MSERTVCFARHEEFAEYVRLRRLALLRRARRLMADPADADDLLRTALMRTRAYWAGITDKSLADAYLLRAMINLRTEWWRARRLEEVPIEHLPEAAEEEVRTRQLLDRHQLLDAPAALSVRQRSVVVLRYWEELSTQETAHALATGTVESTLHPSLTILRQELAAQEAAVRAS
ncbi:sigma factor-like helix-turn-helix DNA-binding protein [Streptomyces antimycoticus]|uniref:sigma factor-like helix-turn-helix DNA-binding protein n=1 Tax=Streptomyces TaxID=1883 RepID=UPI003413BCE7